MLVPRFGLFLFGFFVLPFSLTTVARAEHDCGQHARPSISFIEFESLDLEQDPPAPLLVGGKLKLPVRNTHRKPCFPRGKRVPAVLILHGSAGIDFRGDFYARALNDAGVATLEIDMWEARGVETPLDRPPVPLFNYPDAFSALQFLTDDPNIDPDSIGVLGFSWGAVITMASATETYASQFGGDLRFAAHVAHYPVCFAYNSGIPGTEFVELTGAPVLIQIGSEDDYDEGPEPCFALVDTLAPQNRKLIDVVVYNGAFHGWDRLQVPTVVQDPFSHLGAGGEVRIRPDATQAYKSRRRVANFFRRNLR